MRQKRPNHGPAPIPEEGKWVQSREVTDISGFTHGVGWCAPQQGACKLTLNVKNGVIEEALVETLGCTGMTHSAAMAAKFCPAKPFWKRSIPTSSATRSTPPCASCFCRSPTAARRARFPKTACPSARAWRTSARASAARSAPCTARWQKARAIWKWRKAMCSKIALDEDREIIGYQFVNLGKMMEAIRKGVDPKDGLRKERRYLRALSGSRRYHRPAQRIIPKEEVKTIWLHLKDTTEE